MRESALYALSLADVNNYQQNEYSCKDHCHKRPQLRGKTSFAGICINVGGECLQTYCASGKEGYSKVVQRHCEGKNESGYHSGFKLRQQNPLERNWWGGPQIQRGLIYVGVHLCQFRHNAKHHIGDAEGYVGKSNRNIALRKVQEYDEQEERDSGYDIGINNWNIILLYLNEIITISISY